MVQPSAAPLYGVSLKPTISAEDHTAADNAGNYFFLRRLRRSRRFFDPIFLLRLGLLITTSSTSNERFDPAANRGKTTQQPDCGPK